MDNTLYIITQVSPNSYREYAYLPMRSGGLIYKGIFIDIDKTVNERVTDPTYFPTAHTEDNLAESFYKKMHGAILGVLKGMLEGTHHTIVIKNAFDYYFWVELEKEEDPVKEEKRSGISMVRKAIRVAFSDEKSGEPITPKNLEYWGSLLVEVARDDSTLYSRAYLRTGRCIIKYGTNELKSIKFKFGR